MTQASAEKLPLPVRRAFVVQLSADIEVDRGHWAGRVEHIVSGQAAHLHSLEELLAFMTQMLRTVHVQSPADA
ncbi:MAG: hypothetical protein HY268_19760 [Deltaproteobacteria bacterium]|nr:hypothetical protein [Deltaproteobacteria bacterium]